jgi:predicted Zn-dependent protease
MRDRVGTRVAAPCINLSDSPRFAATLPRSYDALGAPLAPAPLIQDGVLHRVLDRLPWHLVLVGGGRRTWTS